MDDQQAAHSERLEASRYLGKGKQTKLLLDALEKGNALAIEGIWESSDPRTFELALGTVLSSSEEAKRVALQIAGERLFRLLLIEQFNWVIWDEEEKAWINAFGKGLIKLPLAQAVNSYRSALEQRESGVIYGSGESVRLNEGSQRILIAALQELAIEGGEHCLSNLEKLMLQLPPLAEAAGRTIAKIRNRST
ncbi:hypothetical protein L0222_31690 [bacterium]|nr:hypothetical protein [bacterium]MCI0603621.1 hypothetical protein [bacterium]